jgi:hypothetical protein
MSILKDLIDVANMDSSSAKQNSIALHMRIDCMASYVRSSIAHLLVIPPIIPYKALKNGAIAGQMALYQEASFSMILTGTLRDKLIAKNSYAVLSRFFSDINTMPVPKATE